MGSIQSKTLQDIEFPTVLQQLSTRCTTELGKESALAITPLTEKRRHFGITRANLRISVLIN